MILRTHSEPLLPALLGVCEQFTETMGSSSAGLVSDPAISLVLPEPYVPFLPAGSPTILVLAESQNLSDARHDAYATYLTARTTTPRQRFLRLQDGKRAAIPDAKGIGVQPWDDGTLPIAVRAALRVDPGEVAVSNAIPWSWTKGRANTRPFTGPVIDLAGDFWREILEHLNPGTVIAAGGVAQKVVARATKGLTTPPEVIPWSLPSARLDAVAGMFDPKDMMRRYGIPEHIQVEVLTNRDLGRRWALYVCHAVSKTLEGSAGVVGRPRPARAEANLDDAGRSHSPTAREAPTCPPAAGR